MAAHLEEVVVDAELVVAQHLGPESMELALQIGGGGNPLFRFHGERGGGQCPAIELAGASEGQGLQLNEG